MVSSFHPFFMECFIRECDPVKKKLYSLLSMGNDRGALVFRRETLANHHYLSIDDCTEFKIPNSYDLTQHMILNDHLSISPDVTSSKSNIALIITLMYVLICVCSKKIRV